MLDEGSQMGDKCSVKRSVIGSHCRIGSNVKVLCFSVVNVNNIRCKFRKRKLRSGFLFLFRHLRWLIQLS